MSVKTVTDHIFYVYRCQGCRAVVTKLQVLEMMAGDTGRLCPCGSSRISPSDLFGLDWFQPRVWKLIYAYLRGRLLPPPEPSRPVHVEPLAPVKRA